MADEDARQRGYRAEFDDPELAARYDSSQYAPMSWSSLLWEQEQAYLRSLLAEPSFVPRREAYLDFACGTGRVTALFAERFDRATGIDISPAMLQRAGARVPSARFVAADVLAEPEVVDGPFDLVTAFRFILNADPADRTGALRWMGTKMRDDDSRLIVNNHGNLWSHKALPHAVRKIRSRGGVTGNVMSHSAVVALATATGFDVVSVHGTGFLGGNALRLLPYSRLEALQHRLGSSAAGRRLGEDQIYVLAPR